MHVLIVEDNPINAKLLAVNLEKVGYKTVVANTGREALDRLDHDNEIELVISDIMMPEMDGLELLSKMKENEKYKDIPLIVSSSLADMDTVRKAARLGCHHYITKPLRVTDLLQKVRAALGADSSTEEVQDTSTEQEKPKEGIGTASDQKASPESDESAEPSKKDKKENKAAEALKRFKTAVYKAIDELDQGSTLTEDLASAVPTVVDGSKRIGASRLVMVASRLQRNIQTDEKELDESLRQLLLKELKIMKRALESPTGVPGF